MFLRIVCESQTTDMDQMKLTKIGDMMSEIVSTWTNPNVSLNMRLQVIYMYSIDGFPLLFVLLFSSEHKCMIGFFIIIFGRE